MFTKQQLNEMLDLQEKLEERIGGPDWKSAGHNYKLCLFMECAEIIDHCGWKHWKNTGEGINADAIAMEIVDVWHFVMAYMLSHSDFDADYMHSQIVAADSEYDQPGMSLIDLAIGIACSVMVSGQMPFGNFIGLMQQVEMSPKQLYILYISKNVLNWFRQDNGYKEGHYSKVWGEREDNEWLREIGEQLGDDFNASTLYDGLKRKYAKYNN